MAQLEHEFFFVRYEKNIEFYVTKFTKIFYLAKTFWLILAPLANEL